MEERRCPHCMTVAAGPVCSSCGRELEWTAPPHQLAVGTVLDSGGEQHYQIGAALGQGGFGITYAALHLESGQRVAVKEYFPTRCAQRLPGGQAAPIAGQEEIYQGGVNSFLKEARMLAQLDPLPSVVRVLDVFRAMGTAYLVMEFLDGVPLHRKLAKEGKIPAEVLLPRLPALLEDLSRLHRAGVIHRDISPDNVMWMPDGTLKLLDFGSARSVEDGKSMTVMLKHGFAPVEQYQTRGQGPWTDVYALSATLYYCLTGVIPPSAVDRLDDDTLRPPRELGAALTPEEEEVLLWGLEVQPRSRPADVEVFALRFVTKAEQAPPEPPPEESRGEPGGPGRCPAWLARRLPRDREGRIERNKLLLLVGAAAILAAVLIALLAAGGA